MIRILFYTFNEGHLVSDRECDRLRVGFSKVGMELIRWHKDKGVYNQEDFDIVLVKGFSHTYDDVKLYALDGKKIVMLSIGSEWKAGIDLISANEPLKDLYFNASAVIHISKYCWWITEKIFGTRERQYIIIPADEAKLPTEYPVFKGKLKLATTCIPRPVKRTEETERLCKKYGIELVPAYGSVSDFSYYRECHGYIHLSRKEGMPNTVLEALAYGLPCITTNHGGAQEVSQIVIQNDSPFDMWDPSNIEPVDDILFEEAIHDLKQNLDTHRLKVRERVLTELNDRVSSLKFREIFESVLR